MRYLTLACAIGLMTSVAWAETAPSLEDDLNSLETPANQGVVATSREKLYAIQSRYSSLNNRHEIVFSAGKNLNQDGQLDSNQYGGLYRYHVNDKWAFGVNYFRMNNELSSSGKRLLQEQGALPDRDFIEQQIDAMAEYNLFYGKFRLGMDSVAYLDQYIGLGAGQVTLGNSNATAAVLDLGIAFWIGKMMSARLGLKNDFYKEKNLNGTTNVHNMIGYLGFGILLGGEG